MIGQRRSSIAEMRRPQRLSELLEQIGQESREDILAILDAFRAEGVGFLMPPPRDQITDDTIIDISHESLIRQWRHFQQWLREEEADVADLREWQQRAGRNLSSGGGWLDEHDTARAERWKRDIEKRGSPGAWLTRYTRVGAVGSDQVFHYIAESARRVQAARGRGAPDSGPARHFNRSYPRRVRPARFPPAAAR